MIGKIKEFLSRNKNSKRKSIIVSTTSNNKKKDEFVLVLKKIMNTNLEEESIAEYTELLEIEISSKKQKYDSLVELVKEIGVTEEVIAEYELLKKIIKGELNGKISFSFAENYSNALKDLVKEKEASKTNFDMIKSFSDNFEKYVELLCNIDMYLFRLKKDIEVYEYKKNMMNNI